MPAHDLLPVYLREDLLSLWDTEVRAKLQEISVAQSLSFFADVVKGHLSPLHYVLLRVEIEDLRQALLLQLLWGELLL